MPVLYLKTKFLVTLENEKLDKPIELFGSRSGIHASLSMIIPDDNPKLEGMLSEVAFHLESTSLVSGIYNAKIEGDEFTIECDGVFKFSVQSLYVDQFTAPETKWSVSQVALPGATFVPPEDFLKSDGLTDFKSTYKNHFRNTEESQQFKLVKVQTGKTKKFS